MIGLHKFIATVFGIGYVKKGSGTIAAALYCFIWLFVPTRYLTNLWQVLFTIIIFILGVWSGNEVDSVWGKDSNKVVIDEFGGMMVTLLFIPVQLKFCMAAFVLFRFFDIVKPFLIKKLESLPKGWGVMADDLLAGIYANLVLQLIILYFN